MTVFFRIPNWSEYQQYKDRDPSWIKLHRRLLNNRQFMELPLEAKGLLPLMWLLASESSQPREGVIEIDAPDIAFRLREKTDKVEEILTILISRCFIEDVRNRTEPYTEERRGETETEERQRRVIAQTDRKSVCAPNAKNYRLTFDYEKGCFFGDLEGMSVVWGDAYPAVDIAAEIAKARAWMVSNPKRRKYDVARFMSNWLAKAQDRASGMPQNRPITFTEQSRSNTANAIRNVMREMENGKLH